MTLTQMLTGSQARPDNQTLADFALIEDRARRAALARGNPEQANAHDRELCKLMEMMK